MFTREDVQTALVGSRSLNEMKADINTFIAMFVSPFDELMVERHGKFKELRTLQFNTCGLFISTNKRSISLRVNSHLHSFENGAGYLPAEYVEEVWLNLDAILNALRELLPPHLDRSVEFFYGVGHRAIIRKTKS